MPSTSTTWTVLPQGIHGKRLRLLVMPSPRLQPDGEVGTLGDFPAWATWPATLEGLAFQLEVEGAGTVAAEPAGDPVDAVLWGRVFKPGLEVRGFPRPQAPAMIHSYPALAVRDAVREVFSEAARAGAGGPPLVSALDKGRLQALAELARVDDHPEPVAEALSSTLRARHAKLLELAPELTATRAFKAPALHLPEKLSVRSAAFVQAREFLRTEIQKQDDAPPPVEKPRFDFHQAVSLLTGHPALLRRLGLAIELGIEAPEAMAAAGRLRLVADGLPETALCPWTRYELSEDGFVAAPADDGVVRDGMLALDRDDLFHVEVLDIDAAAVRLVETVDLLRKLLGAPAEEPDTDAPLPALRSSGFSIVRDRRGEAMTLALDRGVKLDAAITTGKPEDQPDLDADDLVRGYRLDVWDADAKRWRSLHQRRVTYEFHEGDPVTVEEEGYIKPAVTRKDGKERELFVHEVLFGWDGWSLSAPRPGRVIGAPGGPGEPEQLAIPEPSTVDGFDLTTRVRVLPGTLPRLRYGHTYRFRVRAVDLAAGGLGLDDAGDEHATAEHRYVRYEPVAAPAIVRRWLDTEGESLERVVIRSDVGVDAAAYAQRADVVKALQGADHEYHATGERHLAAPKVSQWMAELHGMFDHALGKSGDHAKGWKTAVTEAGMLHLDHVDEDGSFVRAKDGDLVLSKEKGVRSDADAEHKAPRAEGELGPGQYFARQAEQIELPYLPDPLASGVVIAGLPGWEGKEPFEFFWNGEWPHRRPIRLCVTDGEGGPEAHADRIEVHLPPAEIAVLSISSLVTSEGRAILAADEAAGRGGTPYWMLAPARELRLVHAVQRPLEPPRFDRIAAAARGVGDTHIDLDAVLKLHAKSTGRVELVARWNDTIDRGAGPVELSPASAIPAAYDLQRDEDEIAITPPRMPLLDLVARMAPKDFVKELAAQPEPVAAVVAHQLARVQRVPEVEDGQLQKLRHLAPALEAAMKDVPIAPPRLVELRKGREARHDFADTKHRVVRYVPRGTTRYREYFPPEIARDPEAVTSPDSAGVASGQFGEDVVVLSSARPLAPVVRAVLPTFRWETEQDDADRTVRVRHGRALRVLLERPWYSSGEGEQLAVVLPAPDGDPVTAVKMSAWGLDPVWDGAAGPEQPLRAAHFPRAVAPRDGIVLAEAPDGPRVSVAPHDVVLDEERNLWVCELDFAPDAVYTPFVRLTVARYQPDSVDGVHLSTAVVAEFAQLLPERRCSVSRTQDCIEVELSGPSARNLLGDAGVVVQAIVERQPTSLEGDIGWVVQGEPVVLGANGSADAQVWAGRVVPEAAAEGFRQRLRVAEHEWFPCDPDVAERYVGHQPVASRLVYTDVFDLHG